MKVGCYSFYFCRVMSLYSLVVLELADGDVGLQVCHGNQHEVPTFVGNTGVRWEVLVIIIHPFRQAECLCERPLKFLSSSPALFRCGSVCVCIVQ